MAGIGTGQEARASVQINAGGAAVSPFAADSSYSGGGTYSSGNTITTTNVPNAAPAAVYQTERAGTFTYTITGLTASTAYVARLHFAEIYWTAAGKREFNVAINGTTVLTNFDVFASAGAANQAVIRNFNATSNTSGQITIAFSNGAVDQPKVSGLEVSSGSVPVAPTSVYTFSGNAAATICWTASATAYGYTIYRSTSAGNEGSIPLYVGPNTTSYTDTGLTNGTTYYYKIVAVNANGESAASSEVSALPTAYTTSTKVNAGGQASSPFAIDSGFTGGTAAIVGNTETVANIPNSAPAAVYQSERWGPNTYTVGGLSASTAYVVRLHFAEFYFSSAGQRMFNVAINGTSVLSNFDVFAAANGANIAVVRNFNATSDSSGKITIALTNGSADNAKISGFEIIGGTVPAAPTGAYATSGTTTATVHWSAVTGATSYNVYRSTTAGAEGSVPLSTGQSGTSYSDSGLTTGTKYYYTVVAVNANGESAASSECIAVPNTTTTTIYQVNSGGAALSPFEADNYFVGGTAGSSGTSIVVTGVPNAAPVNAYYPDRYSNFSYVFKGLTPGTSYTVRLHNAETIETSSGTRVFNVAINGTAVLTNYDLFVAAGAANRAVVRNFNAVADSNGQITVAYTDVVYVSQCKAIEVLGGTVTAAPTGVYAITTSTSATVHWTAVTGATSYNLYRSLTQGYEGSIPYKTGLTGTSTADTGLTTNTEYYYTVVAVNANGESATSPEIAALCSSVILPTSETTGYAWRYVMSTPASTWYQTTFDDSAWTFGLGGFGTASYGGAVSRTAWTATPGDIWIRKHFTINGSVPASRAVRMFYDEGSEVYINGVLAASTTGYTTIYVSVPLNTAGQAALVVGDNVIAIHTTQTSGGQYIDAGIDIAAPTTVYATSGTTTATVNWTAVSGATSYNIYRGTSAYGEGTTPIATGVTGTSYTDTGLTSGTKYYYKVSAVDSYGTGTQSSEAMAVPNTTTSTIYQVNAGGAAVTPFEADNYYSGGNSGSTSNTITTTSVPNAAPASVYQTSRSSATTYTFTGLTSGTVYTVRLHETEFTKTGVGQRQFNVAINGTTVLTNFDIYLAAGAGNRALVRNFNATADSTGKITVAFTNGALDICKLSALEVLGGTVTTAPTGVYATSGVTTATLHWTAVSGATSYNIYRSTTAGGEGSIPLATGQTGSTYSDTALTTGTKYYYNVVAVDANGESAASSEAIAVPNTTTTTIYQVNAGGAAVTPFEADNYFATGTTNFWTSTMTVAGVPNAAPAAVYQAERYNAPGYTFTGLTPNTSYVVRLHWSEDHFTASGQRIFNQIINGVTVLSNFDIFTSAGAANRALVRNFNATSDANGQITVTASVGSADVPSIMAIEVLGGSVTAAPTALSVNATSAQAVITWTAPAGSPTGYNLYRSTSAGAEGSIPYKTGLSSTTYTDTGLTNGSTYYYRVVAVNADGESAESTEGTGAPNALPAAPTGLTAVPGNTKATLSWTAATGGGTITYTVSRSTTNGSGYVAVTGGTGLSTTSFTDPTGGTALTNGTTYYYVVTATNNGGTSANSNQASVIPNVPLLILTKRITAINGVNVTGFVTDGTGNDLNAYWPSPNTTYLRGSITSTAKPGDSVEYTVYFLVTGSGSITNVAISDVLPANTTFVTGSYTGQTPTDGVTGTMGIAVASSASAYPSGPTVYMTNAADADRGTFYVSGTAVTGICTAVQNVSGAVVVNMVTSPTTLPAATAASSPYNSYGFVRYNVTVN